MTSKHFENLLGVRCKRSPFYPFTIELIGGVRFEVDDPHAMVVRDGVAVFLKSGGTPVWFDYENVTQIGGDIADASV